MKRNKITVILITLACIFTSCVEKSEPVSPTEVAEEMYRVWLEEFTEYNTCYISTLFWLDGMLQLSEEERDSILQADFQDGNEILKTHPNGTYEILWGHLFGDGYGDYTMNNRMLVKTDGKTLETLGAKWEVVLNVNDEYIKAASSVMKLMPDRESQETQDLGLKDYPDNIPFYIECVGNEKWALTNTKDAKTKDVFSVDYTMELITPGNHVEIFMSDRVMLNGNGRLLAKDGVPMDYKMENYILENNVRGAGGSLILTATQIATGSQVNANIECEKTGYSITYRGVTTHHKY